MVKFPCFSYWLEVLKQAFKKAWDYFGIWLTIASIVSIFFLIAFLADWFRKWGVDVNWWLLVVPGIVSLYAFFMTLVVAPYQMHKKDQRLLAEWNELYSPKLVLACGLNVPGSRVIVESGYDFDHAFRLVVKNVGFNSIANCQGRLISIVKDGQEIWANDEAPLTFVTLGAYSIHKNIEGNGLNYLEVVGLKEGRVSIAVNTHGRTLGDRTDARLQEHGKFILLIALSGHSTVSIGATLHFNWTGTYEDATLDLIEQHSLIPNLPESI
jgi:hypothetical protein